MKLLMLLLSLVQWGTPADGCGLRLHAATLMHVCVDVDRRSLLSRCLPSPCLQDLVMPSCSGLDLLRFVRSNEGLNNLPVVSE